MNPPKCPACLGPKPPSLRICPGCRITLPARSRNALDRRDDHADDRVRELLDQLDRGVPLRLIELTS